MITVELFSFRLAFNCNLVTMSYFMMSFSQRFAMSFVYFIVVLFSIVLSGVVLGQ